MTTQESALRAYYAHMTDAELLSTASNRKSFIEVAQRLVAEELRKRSLPEPVEPAAPPRRKGWWFH